MRCNPFTDYHVLRIDNKKRVKNKATQNKSKIEKRMRNLYIYLHIVEDKKN